ncbi:retroviral-like aspartic protease family protein [Candidatus Nitronereus thalassa]|uniref:Retroviral-like aspartic protease family protein n=1 Tax=Candidatus Nitronereus thalassa TaxID=3020898 RepID=A0ABU3K3T2_9BACT|nr:retroviral-like aspartic protease family protein [Candidatus Nitronereus thalassa]MDT7041067.1 retroviral-like aspartic protease family protein [Candidatus Nitronereus thalassa]
MRTRSTFCSKGFAWGLTILVLVAINPTAMATMYRCFDAQGSVVLTDSPAQLEDCTILDPKKPTAQIAPSPIPNPAQAHPPRQHPKRASISQRYEQTKEGTTKEQSDQDNEAIDKKKEELETITVPITKIGGSMVVQVTLNGSVDAHLIVDTGATMTVLSYDIGIELGLLSGSDVSLNTVNTAGGSVQVSMSNLESLQVGAAHASNVAVAIHDLPDGISGISGLLGMSFLRNFEVTLDADQGFLRLRPKAKK